MKKIYAIAICFVLLAVSFTSVFAGKWVDPKWAPFYETSSCSSNNVTTVMTEGSVHIVDPMGKTSLIFQGHVVGLEPNKGYDAWVRNLTGYTGSYLYAYLPLGYFKLATFMTDEYGNGDFLIKINSDELPDGEYEIQVAINNAGASNNIGCTYLATQWNPGLFVSVESK